MGTQIFRLKFENFIYQKLKFSQGVRTPLTHLVWVRHCKMLNVLLQMQKICVRH